jgi:hypothetical protein
MIDECYDQSSSVYCSNSSSLQRIGEFSSTRRSVKRGGAIRWWMLAWAAFLALDALYSIDTLPISVG